MKYGAGHFTAPPMREGEAAEQHKVYTPCILRKNKPDTGPYRAGIWGFQAGYRQLRAIDRRRARYSGTGSRGDEPAARRGSNRFLPGKRYFSGKFPLGFHAPIGGFLWRSSLPGPAHALEFSGRCEQLAV